MMMKKIILVLGFASLLTAQVLPPSHPRVLVTAKLHHAVAVGNMLWVRQALADGADPNRPAPSGLTPLGRCCFREDGDIFAKVLIEAGARSDVSIALGKRIPLIALAALNLHDALAEVLLQAMKEPEQRREAGKGLLRMLLDKDGLIEIPLSLMGPNEMDHMAIIKLVSQTGLSLDEPIAEGRSPLMLVLDYGDRGLATLLLKNGAHAGRLGPQETQICLSIGFDDLDWMRLALVQGLDPNQCNACGETPLIQALLCKKHEWVKLLLAHHADPNHPDPLGRYPLHLAAASAPPDVIHALLEAGASLSVRDAQGETPATIALRHGNTANTALLQARDPSK